MTVGNNKLSSIQDCTGCSACFAVCGHRAIQMLPDEHGFLYPFIDAAKCKSCHLCEKVCPVLKKSDVLPVLKCYAARSKNENLRRESSSGGLFSEFAKVVLSYNGSVYGCGWKFGKAVHLRVDSENQLDVLRKSKYVQSDMQNSFRECLEDLKKGKNVLFSGTPCQIAGLKSFLKKDYINLYTVELICHGVPSPAVFEQFKREYFQTANITEGEFHFRNNDVSWSRNSLAYKNVAGKKNFIGFEDTVSYIRAFLNNLSLRASCYHCRFREGRSGSDITIGDFWGLEEHFPHFYDDKGTSAVILHTEKGCRLYRSIVEKLEILECSIEQIIKPGNLNYELSVPCPNGRAYFMRHYKDGNMMKVVNRSNHGPWLLWMGKRVLRKIKRIFLNK